MSRRPSRNGYHGLSIAERFYSYVDKREPSELDPDPCWPWIGGKARKRRGVYGKFWLNGKNVSAHRVALYIKTGEMPDDREGCHSPRCVTTLCCKPSHLNWGTRIENEAHKKEKAELCGEDLQAIEEALRDLRQRRG